MAGVTTRSRMCVRPPRLCVCVCWARQSSPIFVPMAILSHGLHHAHSATSRGADDKNRQTTGPAPPAMAQATAEQYQHWHSCHRHYRCLHPRLHGTAWPRGASMTRQQRERLASVRPVEAPTQQHTHSTQRTDNESAKPGEIQAHPRTWRSFAARANVSWRCFAE